MTDNPMKTKICRKDCQICQHPLLEEIYKLRREGGTYRGIAEKINNMSAKKVTPAALQRHLSKWREVVKGEIVRKQMEEKLAEIESSRILTCQKWTDQLLTRTFKRIWDNFDTIPIDISDLERLAKLRILLREGEASAADGITEILKRAAEKYHINIEQNPLWQTEEKNPLTKAIEIQAEQSKESQRSTNVENGRDKTEAAVNLNKENTEPK